MSAYTHGDIDFARLRRNPVLLLAFGFGSGLAKKAPGTCGTLVAIPIYLLLQPLSLLSYMLVVVAMFACGVWICGRAAKLLEVHDHPGIVWDEFCGLLVTMLAAPPGWWWLVAGFFVFRFFDIVKPWPIRYVDRTVHGGLGIMLDDVLAGLCSFAVLQLAALFIF